MLNRKNKGGWSLIAFVAFGLIVFVFQVQPTFSQEEAGSVSFDGGSGFGAAGSLGSVDEDFADGSFFVESKKNFNDELYIQSGFSDLQIDANIVKEFREQNETRLRLIVNLGDNSGISIIGIKEQRRAQIEQIDGWFDSYIDEFLADYSKDESVRFISKGSRGFLAQITEEGFLELASDNRVRVLYYDAPVYGTNNETPANNSILDTSEDLEEQGKRFFWFWIIAGILCVTIVYPVVKKVLKKS